MAEDGSLTCPRGALSDVLDIVGLDQSSVVDRTVFPHAELGSFMGELRPYQQEAISAVILAGGGVVQAPTGSGKTVVAVALTARLSTPTLVIVHTSVLLEQTVSQFKRFLGCEVGVVGGGDDDWRDVTVAMVQTLVRRDLTPLRDRFGLVILDEAHHCPASTFNTVVQNFSACYRVGLTATPTRKDRLHPVLFDVVGPIVHRVKPATLVAEGSIAPPEVVEVRTAFTSRYNKDYARLINRIVKDPNRNALIVDAVIAHRGEMSLVLSERVAHCHLLARMLGEKGVLAEVMTGEMSKESRSELITRFRAGEVQILVSTTALVGEGFDLPAIDTIFLTVPNGNPARTTQILGRALRPSEGKKSGRIVDFVDHQVPLLMNQFLLRSRVYRSFD